MKDIAEMYTLSKDYEKLLELVELDYRIPCIVDYKSGKNTFRDYAKVYKYQYAPTIIIGVRGIEYGGWTEDVDTWTFSELCEYLNLEWFIPHGELEHKLDEKDKEIQELKKSISKVVDATVFALDHNLREADMFTQDLKKQLSWIEQNHPEVYKQIPR